MNTAFTIYPAIDVLEGRVVRLRQGDFDRAHAYADDPVAVARAFADAGASWLHVVDLEAAQKGGREPGGPIAAILDAVATRLHCEIAGGIRTETEVRDLLATGASRIVLGTAALRDPDLVGRIVAEHGVERVACAIDVRDGRAIGEGWRADAGGLVVAGALAMLRGLGVRTFEVTAIDRDGLLAGPDLGLLASSVAPGVDIVASAGIRSVEDLLAIRSLGCSGAIVGRALYDGSLRLEDALALERSEAALWRSGSGLA